MTDIRIRPLPLIVGLCLGLGLNACSPAALPNDATLAAATLTKSSGEVTGMATLVASAGRLRLEITATGLTAGKPHGIHLHTTGNCTGPGFAAAGPHLNPAARAHGLENPDGSHLGDLPNIAAQRDGTARLSFALPGNPASLRANIFDSDGTAIILHAEADDLRTDPSGNSGARIACGIFAPLR